MPTDRPRPPSVERLLAAVRPHLALGTEADAVAAVARDVVAEERARLADGAPPTNLDGLAGNARERLASFGAGGPATTTGTATATGAETAKGTATAARSIGPDLTPALNGTGVILHTNLGRAPWPAVAIEAARRAAAGYSLLEFDRIEGRRGPRFRVAEEHLIALTGAEDALITINNAAALVLAVGLAGRRGIAVSRGELVEIGGGVRIPEIVRRGGAKLIEVGTTNRTRATDFEGPLADGRAAAVLRVHPSNFTQAGFTETPDPRALAELAHAHGAIVIDDLGSGAFLETAAFGWAHEPTPAERLAAGADLVTFSGDKLVGGPQAGLIVGRADLIARIRKDPLARAVRSDKVILAAIAATLGLYRAGRATSEIPIWRMIAASTETLGRRAEAIRAALPASVRDRVEVHEMESTIGGGSLPGERLESVGLAVLGSGAAALAGRLRAGEPAVVGRVERGALLVDLRTIDATDDAALGDALAQALEPR